MPARSQSAANEWTWYGGTTSLSSGGIVPVYGTMGMPAAANTPGSRAGSSRWIDKSGNLWLFSGSEAFSGYYNDLWMFNPATDQWTWVGGSDAEVPGGVPGGVPGVYGTLGTPAAGNTPGGRLGAVTWTDGAGNFWMFGGVGLDSAGQAGYLNDLWEFNPSTSQWTWMGGSSSVKCVGTYDGTVCGQPGVYGDRGAPAPANIPGSRVNAVGWSDSQSNFWLFGGSGLDSNGSLHSLNDLWEFTPSTGQWTWVSGSSTVNVSTGQPGVYGTLGIPASANTPGARAQAVSWSDAKGNLWLFGGYGVDSADAIGDLNDLWQFNPSAGEWTWMGGGSSLAGYYGRPGVYATWMTPASANQPGGRRSATSWTDGDGNFWLYGGLGADSNGVSGELDDLWEFNPLTSQWAWMGGNDTFVINPEIGEAGQVAVYGALQMPDFANTPGGLDSAVGWTDKSGNLWLYGGYGFDANGFAGVFNDLWEYQPTAASLPTTATPSFSMNTGSYAAGQTLTISDATPGAAIFYFISGAVAPTQYAAPITIPATETVDAVAVAPGYAASAVAAATFTLPNVAMPTFSLAPGIFSTTQTITLSDATPGATIYYAINGAPTTSSNLYNGPITVSTSETIEALAVVDGYANSPVSIANYTIWPASATNDWAWMGGLTTGAENQDYGVFGVPAISNIPAARIQASTWTDSNGNFWLFGGEGDYGGLNDLWRLNPSTNEWAWMGGSIATICTTNAFGVYGCNQSQPGAYGTLGTPAPGNTPGGRRGASSWTDSNGNFWLFGGSGLDADGTLGQTVLNDLWKFDPATNEWAWMSGSSSVAGSCFTDGGGEVDCALPSVYGTLGTPAAANTPGSREDATAWVDEKGDLWLFGGWSFDVSTQVQYYFDELWMFSPSTNQWAWMGGSNTRDRSACFKNVNVYYRTCGEPGTYGTVATPAAANMPGGRAASVGWTDHSGNLWLFSGSGFDTNGNFGDPDDLWEFNPSTNLWSWMGGNSAIPPCADYDCSPPSVQGTLGIPAAGNIPGGRDHASGWTDSKGNFWLYGVGLSNGLWEFTPSANEWAWMGGIDNSFPPEARVYGVLGTPAPGNNPGGRYGSSNWTDSGGNLWLFAGQTPLISTVYDNDLWRYEPSAPAPVPGFAVVDWNYQAFTIQAGTSGATTISTVVADGFDTPVTLSAVGLPSGITASFSPGSITGFGASQATFSVGLGVAPGNYTLTVAGTGSGVTETTTVSLAVASAPPPTFTLGTSASSLTINSGASGAVTLTVTPEYGFNSAVSFACSGLPPGVACSFSPATITPSGSAATTVLTISANSQSAASRSNPHPLLPLTGVAFGLCLFIKRRRRSRFVIFVAALAGLGSAFGCGGGSAGAGGGGGSAPTPVTSQVTITATGGSVQQVSTLSLTLN